MQLPDYVNTALRRLERAGFEAYAVGGCVRDRLMGRTPADYDVTTAALPRETAAVFAGERIIGTGMKHGTVTVLLDGRPLEITTFRVDGAYSDARHPDAVTFTRSLRADLARRDFTVNAMAYSTRTGLVDPFGAAWATRRRASGRTHCASCAASASLPSSASPSTLPPRRRRGKTGRCWGRSAPSASPRS